MTAALHAPGDPWSPQDRPHLASDDVGLVRPFLSLASVAGVAALFVWSGRIRELEAGLSAVLARLGGIPDATVVGSSVLFTVDGRTTGYGITLGCTVAFLAVPFSVVTAALLAIRRVPVWRALTALALALTTVAAFNQARLLVIAEAMRAWGAELGYSRTHVLVGTFISTTGVVVAGSVYLLVLLHETEREALRRG